MRKIETKTTRRYGTAIAGAALALATAMGPETAAAADLSPTLANRQVAQAGTAARAFAIPAQPLASALDRFADAAGISFAYRTGDISSLRSPGVTGTFAPREALERLLAGTGVTFEFTGGSTVSLAKAPDSSGSITLGTVTVEGASANRNAVIGNLSPVYPGEQVARGSQLGILGNRDMMDTPFNVTSYTSETIRNQQATTLADVLANDPSVRTNIRGRGTNNGGGDNVFIRGFLFMNQDASLDGSYGVLPYGTVPLEMVERVEVLKGPNALLNGMAPSGTVGGSINIVPKRAEDNPITRLTTTYSSDFQLGGHVDVGRRFGPEKEFGVRVNGVYRSGDTPVDGQSSELVMGSAALDYRGERLRLSADLGYQDDQTDAPSSFGGGIRIGPAVTRIPSAPKASARTAQPWEHVEFEDKYAVVRGEFDIAPQLTVYGSLGARDNYQYNLRSNFTLTSNAGAITVLPVYYPQFSDTTSGQAGIRGSIATGPVKHDFNLGYASINNEGGYWYQQWTAATSSLYGVGFVPRPPADGLPSAVRSFETNLASVAIADTMSILNDRVMLTLGLRRQQVENKNFDIASGATLSTYDKQATTPAIGLVVKPWQNVSLYANYIEGLSQGFTAPATAQNANEVFPPVKTKQKEIGAKVDFGQIGATLSLFEITQPSVITTPGSTATAFIYRVDGEQRNRGVELTTFGEVARGVRVLGGVTYIDPIQTKTQGGINDGKEAPAVPNWTVNLGAEWDASFAPGLTFSGRVITTSDQYTNATNTLSLDGWHRFDLGARYLTAAMGRPLTLRANVFNVLDDSYWESVAVPQGLRLSAPRTFMLSATMDF